MGKKNPKFIKGAVPTIKGWLKQYLIIGWSDGYMNEKRTWVLQDQTRSIQTDVTLFFVFLKCKKGKLRF